MPLNCLEKIFTERGVCVIADIVKTRQEKTNNCLLYTSMEKEKIGKYIRKKRIEKGMTQQQLAEKIQVTEKAVSRWETGVSPTKGY